MKKIVIVGTVLLLIGSLGIWGYSVLAQSTDSQMTEETVVVSDIVDDDRYAGVIESQSREVITVPLAQEIDTLYVADGQQVTKDMDLYDTAAGETITASVDGEVTGLDFSEGDTIKAGETVMEIVDYQNLQVSIKVDEYQLSDIAVDDPVTILIDSIDQTIEGTVSEISREAKNENGVSYFTAIVDLQGDEAIRIGMNAEVVIVKDAVQDALTVPVEAILFNEDEESYVICKKDDRTTENRLVTTGVTDGVSIQIVEGLSKGETVLIPMTENSETASLKAIRGNN